MVQKQKSAEKYIRFVFAIWKVSEILEAPVKCNVTPT